MKKNGQLLLAAMVTSLFASTATANTDSPRTIRGSVSIQQSVEDFDDNDSEVPNSNTPNYVGDLETSQHNAQEFLPKNNEPKESPARIRQREMENDIKIGNPPEKPQEAKGDRSPEEFDNQEQIAAKPPVAEEAQNTKAPEEAPKRIVSSKPRVTPIVYGSTGSFNTDTIRKLESEAIIRDTAKYQEFLNKNSK